LDLTWFELRPVAMEIGTRLRGYYVNNVYRSGAHAITLRLRNSDGSEALLVVHVRRAAWITRTAPRLQQLDPAVRRLRDSLLRLRIAGAEAVKNERIIAMDFDGYQSQWRMYMEFFGTGNLVLVSGGVIAAALSIVRGKDRSIAPGLPYGLPTPRRSVFEASEEELAAVLKPGRPLNRALGKWFLAPSKYLEEALWRSGIRPDVPADSISRRDLVRLVEELSRLFSELTSGSALYLYRGAGILEVSAARLKLLEEERHLSPELHESPSEALDAALHGEILEPANSSEESGAEAPSRLEDELRAQEERAHELSSRASAIRSLASALAAGSIDVDGAMKSLGGDVEVRGGHLHVGDMRVPAGNPYALSSALYDYAKRLESAASILESKAAELRGRVNRLDEEESAASITPGELVARERKWYERHRWFYTSGALLAVGGRDASGNSSLIRRYLEEGDIVFHAEIVGSPFFILKGGRSSAAPTDLEEVAQATVSFSRAWREGLAAADAYYVYPEQVSPGAPSGEYLPRGSFMIKGTRNYIRGLKLEVAVGFCAEPTGDNVILCSGPRRSLDERGIVYVVMEPGHMKASDTASKVVRVLSDHLPPDRSGLRGILNVDDVARLLPPGNSRIIEVARGKRLRDVGVSMGPGG